MSLPVLDKTGTASLADQLVLHFQGLVRDGRLREGDRLPTIREVAKDAGVTRTTVQEAYRRLQEQGIVSSTVGRGTVVAGAPREDRSILSPGARDAYEHLLRLPEPSPIQGPTVCNFAALNPDQSLFPVDAFGASLQRVLAERGPQLLGYGQPTGDPDLRQILASMSGGTDADEILVTNGAQQGIDLVLRTFTRPGDGVAVAVPTYHHLFGLLKAHDLRLVPVRSHQGVFDLDDLRRVLSADDVRLLYVMPTFHNPTGRTLDQAQRAALMDVVQETQVPVLEDEFELDLRFRGSPMPSLRSLDPRDLTVTVRTFSKGLFPGVRLGWVHAGPAVRGPMAALKRYIDLETSPLLQAALVDFLESGALVDYVAILRRAVAARHEAAAAAFAGAMPSSFTWTEPDGGFLTWCEGPPGFDADRLAQAAAARGVAVTPGRLFYPSASTSGPVAGMRLSLSRADVDQVRAGIEVLGRCAHEQLNRAGPSERPLIL